jgi:type I restriction enzyme, S subunit
MSVLKNIVDNRGKTAPTAESGIPLIATNCILNDHLYPVYDKIRFVTQETYETWFRGHPKPGDYIFVLKGSPGRIALVPDPVDFCIAQDMVAIRADESKIYPRYLFAVLRSESIQREIENLHVGSMIPHFKKTDFEKLQIPLVDTAAQKFIGDMYFLFSDKIELNNKMNKNLEEMAQAIFKQWFVDFEFPDENGNPYKTSGGKMIQSEFGEIPEGWSVSRLVTHIEALRGLSYKGSGLSNMENGFPMHNLNSILEGGGYKYSGIKYYTGDYKDRHIVNKGDIIVANTEQGHKYKLIGYPAIVPDSFGEIGIFSQHIYRVLILKNSYLTKEFLYYLLMAPDTRSQIIAATNGSTVNMLAIDGLRRPVFKLPPRKMIDDFSILSTSVSQKININIKENNSLAEARDQLLQKLMSGEIRV